MINLIRTRRSIRKFRNSLISNEKIKTALEAAMFTPSARNKQPWQFIVITERNRLDILSDIHPYAKMLKQATCCIIVCCDLNREESAEYAAIGCAAATQNILLAMHSMGLGSVWLGIYPREERMTKISEFLNLPEKIFPFSAVAIGYPDELPEQPERFSEKNIHYEKYGNISAENN